VKVQEAKQNPAAEAAHRARENDRACRRVNRDTKAEPRVVARIPKNGREEFRLTIRAFDGVEKAELRVFERDGCGGWHSTPRHIVIGRGPISGVIDALVEAEARL
jgi:hypothetical protein